MLRVLALIMILGYCFFSVSFATANERPLWVATTKPVHSLVALVAEDLGFSEPKLLVKEHHDPHHFALKPSQARLIEEADRVFYAHHTIESFIKPDQTGHYHELFTTDAIESSHGWLNPLYFRDAYRGVSNLVNSNKKKKNVREKQLYDAIDKWLGKRAFTKGKVIWVDSMALSPLTNFLGLNIKPYDRKTIAASPTRQCIALTHGKNSRIEKFSSYQNDKIIYLDLIGNDIPAGSSHYFALMDRLITEISACLT